MIFYYGNFLFYCRHFNTFFSRNFQVFYRLNLFLYCCMYVFSIFYFLIFIWKLMRLLCVIHNSALCIFSIENLIIFSSFLMRNFRFIMKIFKFIYCSYFLYFQIAFMLFLWLLMKFPMEDLGIQHGNFLKLFVFFMKILVIVIYCLNNKSICLFNFWIILVFPA